MIKKLELWLNIIHYCIYKADYKLHKLSNKINPFVLIGKIPSVKRKFEKQDTTHLHVTNKIWTDKRFGFGVMISGGVLIVILSFLIWGLLSTFLGLFKVYFIVKPIYVIAYGLVSFLVCYLLVFYQDKYLKYFKKIDEQAKHMKMIYAMVSFFFIIGSIALWLYSFRYLPR